MKRDIRKGFSEQRKRAYPSIEDQLDALWKIISALPVEINATPEGRAMARKISEVKERFPKTNTPKNKDGR